METLVPTDMDGTKDPSECVMEMSEFSQTTVKVTLSVTPAISAVEVCFSLFECFALVG